MAGLEKASAECVSEQHECLGRQPVSPRVIYGTRRPYEPVVSTSVLQTNGHQDLRVSVIEFPELELLEFYSLNARSFGFPPLSR